MKVTVIGTGYVGLVAGAGFAQFGHDVTCVDSDAKKIASLLEGQLPIHEPGLEVLVERGARERRLHFSSQLDSVEYADVIVFAVGTPDVDGAADMTAVWQAVKDVAAHIRQDCVIVTKSTVPVGTAQKLRRIANRTIDSDAVRAKWSGAGFERPTVTVGSNPEFLREGSAVRDFLIPDRVVIGADDARTMVTLGDLYLNGGKSGIAPERIIEMSCASAELSKYAANAMLATRISFMNEIALLAEKCGADIDEVKRAVGTDSRIGPHFLNAGCSFGGSCFSKDLRELGASARRHGVNLAILAATDHVNRAQKHLIADRIIEYVERGPMSRIGPRVGVLGVAFKPNTDDVRDAPSLVTIRRLVAAGFEVRAHDVLGMTLQNARRALGDVASKVTFSTDVWETVRGADVLALITEWNEYRNLDWRSVAFAMRGNVVFDGRNALIPKDVLDAGLEYYGIGGFGRRA